MKSARIPGIYAGEYVKACVTLKRHDLGIYDEDTWIIIVNTSLASLLIAKASSIGGDKPSESRPTGKKGA